MWALRNNTPYAAERTWVLAKSGEKHWSVAVKGTFDVLPNGTTRLAEKQEPCLFAPVYIGEPGESSVLYESDLAGPKARTDLILNGSAYAPKGAPATRVDVFMKVGAVSKRLSVSGDRRWKNGLVGPTMTAPEPFLSLPITYERAFGGADTSSKNTAKHRHCSHNPIGTGFADHTRHLVGQLVPNVEYANRPSSSRGKDVPAGFGALASYWSPRLELAGTYDERWKKERFPLLPNDFDERFYQCAPLDQQASGYLRGGEPVELENLSPTSHTRFTLPKIHLTFTTRFGVDSVEHRAKLHTVILEPDHPRVILVWYTSLACHHRVDELDSTVIGEKEFKS